MGAAVIGERQLQHMLEIVGEHAVALAVRQLIIPGAAATISTGDRTASVVIPANIFPQGRTVQVKPMAPAMLPPANPGFRLLGQAIEVTLFDANGKPLFSPTN